MSGSYGGAGIVNLKRIVVRTNNVIPGIESACSDTWSSNGIDLVISTTNGWGTRTRVGSFGDNDSSDSSATVMGLGLIALMRVLLLRSVGAHGTGSGYYFYSTWSNSPHDGARQGWLWIR